MCPGDWASRAPFWALSSSLPPLSVRLVVYPCRPQMLMSLRESWDQSLAVVTEEKEAVSSLSVVTKATGRSL